MISITNVLSYSPDYVVSILNERIGDIAESIGCYCADPVSDFTRSRKLPCDVLMKLIIQFQSKALNCELSDYFADFESLPTKSAFCQQRNKLEVEAFSRLFYTFTHSFHHYRTYKGYYILACDGSDINIPFDTKDEDTFCLNGKNKPYSQFHLNALYDCMNQIYWDLNIDNASKTRECAALEEMISNRRYPSNSIIVADRGYEKYDLIACCLEKQQKFLIRVKDIKSFSSILSNCNLKDEALDVKITKILTRKQTKEIKANKSKYTFITNKSEFSYFDDEQELYEMSFRVVRFKITEDTYECLITNLTEEEFSSEELKQLYHLRWSEETSFRQLKYTIGMVSFHAKKRKYIKQEIYASVILFNLSNIVVHNVELEEEKEICKYRRKANYSTAVTNIRLFLKRMIDEKELIKRIKKILVLIRPERKQKRQIKPQSVRSFNHKAS